jgi:peptide/nickel transport system substrate-binding protein
MKKMIMASFLLTAMLLGVLTECVTAEAVKNDLNMITQVEPDSLDPQGTTMSYAQHVYKNIYDTLMEYNAKNELVANLVKDYSVNENSTVFKFTLKQGVKFHNGEELKASDVVYTVERGKKGFSNPQNFLLIETCTALSDYEVEFKLNSPYSPFLGILATPWFSILNEKATETLGADFSRKPVGSGPYMLVSWAEGENIKLKAFNDYHKGEPSIKDVTIKFVFDQNTALIALEAGDVDYTYVFPESAKTDIKNSKNLKLLYYDSTALNFFTLNHNVEPLGNKLVRQAINIATNRDDIVLVAYENDAIATSQFCNKNTFGYMDIPGYEFNVERAKELMREAGYEKGFKVKITAQDIMTQKMATIFASNLLEIGIETEIESLESNTAVQNFMKGNYEIGVLGINNAQLDFDFMKIIFQPGGSLNLANYDNPALFEKFKDAAALSEPAARLAVYREINDILLDESVYVPVFFPNRAHAMNVNLDISHIGGSSIAEIYNMQWK